MFCHYPFTSLLIGCTHPSTRLIGLSCHPSPSKPLHALRLIRRQVPSPHVHLLLRPRHVVACGWSEVLLTSGVLVSPGLLHPEQQGIRPLHPCRQGQSESLPCTSSHTRTSSYLLSPHALPILHPFTQEPHPGFLDLSTPRENVLFCLVSFITMKACCTLSLFTE